MLYKYFKNKNNLEKSGSSIFSFIQIKQLKKHKESNTKILNHFSKTRKKNFKSLVEKAYRFLNKIKEK